MPIAFDEASISTTESGRNLEHTRQEFPSQFCINVVDVVSADILHDNLVKHNKSVREVAREA